MSGVAAVAGYGALAIALAWVVSQLGAILQVRLVPLSSVHNERDRLMQFPLPLVASCLFLFGQTADRQTDSSFPDTADTSLGR